MTYEEHQRYIEQTFDSYCKAVIKNTAVDIHRRERTKQKHEISLSSFTDVNVKRHEKGPAQKQVRENSIGISCQ